MWNRCNQTGQMQKSRWFLQCNVILHQTFVVKKEKCIWDWDQMCLMTVSRQTCVIVFLSLLIFYTRMNRKLRVVSHQIDYAAKMMCRARRFKETADLGFKSLNNFATYFCMEMPHFEYGWLIGEEICLSRWYQFSFNIYPQLFLQEIAILFIYYLFLGLLDLIDFENEKPLIPYDRP